MNTNHSPFIDEHWTFEPADPSVGIFGEGWIHEICPVEYDQGVTTESRLSGRKVRAGVVYADETHTLTCNDCGATTQFTDEALMGFEGEQGV